jgi:energy-coupling factor transporter ATP-binding protein EcfA2
MAQNFLFTQATKTQSKLRMAVYGVAGSGKTLSLLLMGRGIIEETGGKMAVIDSENNTASKYSGELQIPGLEGLKLEFDTLNLLEPTVYNMVKAIHVAKGYDVLIIDSLSHSWKELLQEVERLAKAKYRGNTWSAWSEGTPLQMKMVRAIQTFPGHLGVTMRSATEWMTQDNNGKAVPQRVGLKPEQGKGIEYEFDMLGAISPEHLMFVEKDRSGKFQDQTIEKPGIQFGKELLAWLNEGAEDVPLKTKEDLITEGSKLGLTPAQIGEALKVSELSFDPHLWDEMLKAVVVYANGAIEQPVA